MKWGIIFENYTMACYELYKWICGADAVDISLFDERAFYNSLLIKGYFNNEERTFEFFDSIYILVYVFPLGLNTFQSVATSEYRSIICNSHPKRRDAVLSTLQNAFDLLQERQMEFKNPINNTST